MYLYIYIYIRICVYDVALNLLDVASMLHWLCIDDVRLCSTSHRVMFRYSIMEGLISVLLFSLSFTKNFSQTKKIPENIYSVIIQGSKYNYPVYNLNEKIYFSFDDLNIKKSSYYYKINHFDYKWKLSKILKSEYIEGYDDNLIEFFENSYNTLVDYTNYQISIPNQDVKLWTILFGY